MEKHLKELYGFNNFRDYQKDIIKDILNNENMGHEIGFGISRQF